MDGPLKAFGALFAIGAVFGRVAFSAFRNAPGRRALGKNSPRCGVVSEDGGVASRQKSGKSRKFQQNEADAADTTQLRLLWPFRDYQCVRCSAGGGGLLVYRRHRQRDFVTAGRARLVLLRP